MHAVNQGLLHPEATEFCMRWFGRTDKQVCDFWDYLDKLPWRFTAQRHYRIMRKIAEEEAKSPEDLKARLDVLLFEIKTLYPT